ncbi:MAG: class I SAM-dependent methyltransferase [Actinomycetota bacterium]
MGRALLDRLHGDPSANDVIERDDGYVEPEDTARYLAHRRAWSPIEREAFQALRGRVLDVGCGGGRVALALQERGQEVVAIDVSPGVLQVCRERGVRDVELRSVTQISRIGPFDSVALFGNNLGLLADRRRAVWILRRLRGVLTPGGCVVASNRDPYATDDPLHLAYHSRNRARGRMSGQVRLRVRYKHQATPWFDYLFLSLDEVRSITADAGWAVREVIAGPGPEYAVVLESR